MASALVGKYARALLEVAAGQNREEETGTELSEFLNMLQQCAELEDALANPAVPIESRRGILRRLSEKAPFSPIVRNFLLLLLQRNRIDRFEEFLSAYRDLLDERQGVIQVRVATARPLRLRDESRLAEIVSHLTGKNPRLDYQIDDSLIGGMTMQIGSTVFDGSVRSQLLELGRHIAGK